MEKLKLKISHRQLVHLDRCIHMVSEAQPQRMDGKHYVFIARELAKATEKKLIDEKKEYKLTLKPYMATGLYHILVLYEMFGALEIELQQIKNIIHQKYC